MTGPMGGAHPGPHPDNDLLADLAAEVLPDDLAGRVQAHVESCATCAGLLAEADGIRALLKHGEPELMPDDVLIRLEAALVRARTEQGAEEQFTPATPPRGSAAAGPRAGRRIVRRIRVGGGAGGPSGTAGTARVSRLSRGTQPAQRARRQALEEQRADRPSLLARSWPGLRVAAGVVLVLGLGGLAFQFIRGGVQDQSGSATASKGVASAPVLAAVESTGTNYQRDDLKKQVESLIAESDKQSAASSAARAGGSESDQSVRSQAQTSAPAPLASGARGDLLRDPAALRACLAQIGAGDAHPVAVDLARYAGRDAAIIVLDADGGGYDVWVVARDCRANADGRIAVVPVTR